eukprot:EC716675.1.p1 GENE.EC716675.1~~EC716675.1.p1  ORF type:complete len:180 (+),score=32.12 EC716675.1:21-560(+)
MLRAAASAVRGLASAITPAVRGAHKLPELKYPIEKGIGAAVSPTTLDFHYNKHHATYVNNLNKPVAGTPYADLDLVSVITKSAKDSSSTSIFNNAAQHYNHSFLWDCMTPKGSEIPQTVKERIVADFGSVDAFKDKFSASALGVFGSGWTWLAQNPEGKLSIVNTSNAGCHSHRATSPF